MSYIMISNWSTQEWTIEMEEIGRSKFVPMIMSVGATAVQMVRTGENNLSVISHFTNSESAAEAKEKIAAIRSQAATELPMTMLDAKEGEVFASS